MARLKRQRVGASVFTDSTGYHGDNLAAHPDTFAELGTGGAIGNALGKLPYGTALRVTNPRTGKSLVLHKRDIGLGGGAVSGKHRSIDLYGPAARKLGIDGLGVVEISEVSDTGSSTPSAAAAPQAQPAQQAAVDPNLQARRAAILENLIGARHPDSPLVSLGVISKALGGQAAATSAAVPAAQPKPAAPSAPKGFQPHGGPYGFFPKGGGTGSGNSGGSTNYQKGSTPELARRLDKLARALHLRLIGESGYRTPGHSVAVGGFANDPHTRGEASDTIGIEHVSESDLNRFGLTRPFGGTRELNHIQLLKRRGR